MRFNEHSELKGLHSAFSPSSPHWLRYSDEKVLDKLYKMSAQEQGTRLHALAADAISLGIKFRGNDTLSSYTNDAIRYGMRPEQPLYRSPYFFGTADAISFRKKLLRIHDLKTGVTPASMDQLLVYAALFCLEYRVDPRKIGTQLRIYQNNEALIHEPDPEDILDVAYKIRHIERLIAENSDSEPYAVDSAVFWSDQDE